MKEKLKATLLGKAKQYTASMKGGGKKKMTVSDLMGDCVK